MPSLHHTEETPYITHKYTINVQQKKQSSKREDILEF